MTPLDRIKGLRWVMSAVAYSGHLSVTTKPGSLKTVLTHTVLNDINRDRLGKPLENPIVVGLPAYKFKLEENGFYVAMVKKPPGIKRFGFTEVVFYPCVNDPRLWIYLASYRAYCSFCLGSYAIKYSEAADYYGRLMVAAEFMQMARTDRYGGDANRSIPAYSLGIVGDEIIQSVTTQTQ